jgi:outer membrane protein TolC
MKRAAAALAVLTTAATALAALPTPARAQQGDTILVSLEDALEIARRNNPAYRRAVNDLDLNAPETAAAWGADILPRVELNLSTNFNGNRQTRGTDNFGNPIANPDPQYVYFSSTRQGIGLYWQLQGPSLWNRKQRLDAVNAGRLLAESVAGEALRIGLRRRFFYALEQEELLLAEEAVAEASRSDREAAQRLFELALKTYVDVLQAELLIEQQQLVVREQRGRRDQARIALRTVLGQRDLPPVRPEVTAPPVFDPAELDGDALVGQATDASAPVRLQESALRQADVQVSRSRGLYWPTLSAGWQIGRYVQAQESGSLFSFGGLGDAQYNQFNVQMSVPFLNNVTGNRLQIAQAEVQRESQRDALREAQLEAEQAALLALVTLENRWATLTIVQRSLAIAQEALGLAREEYRLGGRTFEQLQQSVKSEADGRRQLIQARYGFVYALLDLESAVGGTIRDFVR